MKKYAVLIGVIALAGMFFSACSTSQPVSRQEKSPFYDNAVVVVARPEVVSLANLLRQLPSVVVSEKIRGTTVTIRGGAPLFVLDGMRIGHSFDGVADVVNFFDITAIELLRDPTETAMYGPGTQYGVIIVHTKPFNAEEEQ